MARAPKGGLKAAAKAAKTSKRPAGSGGRTMGKLLVALALIAGAGYVAFQVPLGGRTLAEQARAAFAEPPPPAAAPKAANKAEERRAPARKAGEEITDEDRAALEALLPR